MLGRTEEEPPPQSLISGATHAVSATTPEPPPHRGPREGPLLFLFLVLTLAASAYVLKNAEDNAVADPKQKAARGEIKGLGPLSMLRAANLRRALAKIDASEHPLIWSLRVAPDRVNVSTRDADGTRKFVAIDPGFGVTETDAGVGEDDAVRAARIDVDAPARMLRAVAKKAGQPLSAIDYVTTSFSSHVRPTWFLALKEGPAATRQWIAEADGTDVRRPGEPSTADRRRARAEQRRLARQQRRLQVTIRRRAACLQKARSAEAAARCIERYQP